MVTTAQIFTIIGILCTPMISIAALVLSLAAMNLSLGVRKLYVNLLGFIFDYATKIKKDKELSNVPPSEPSTPSPSAGAAKLSTPIVERAPDDPVEITPQTTLLGESKAANNATDHAETSQEEGTGGDTDQKTSSSASQTDIQFKLGTSILGEVKQCKEVSQFRHLLIKHIQAKFSTSIH
jgi:hypothetical protein